MKTVLVALIFFGLGIAGYWGYNNYQSVTEENVKLRKMVRELPSPSSKPSATMEPGLEPEKVPDGSIEGALSYPSEGIPPLAVYAIDTSDNSVFFKVNTNQNQLSYSLSNVEPGIYHILAYPQGKLDTSYAGGYTNAVPCGLSVDCTDHSLVDVEVKPGQTTKNIDLKDWYAPKNSFPVRPQE